MLAIATRYLQLFAVLSTLAEIIPHISVRSLQTYFPKLIKTVVDGLTNENFEHSWVNSNYFSGLIFQFQGFFLSIICFQHSNERMGLLFPAIVRNGSNRMTFEDFDEMVFYRGLAQISRDLSRANINVMPEVGQGVANRSRSSSRSSMKRSSAQGNGSSGSGDSGHGEAPKRSFQSHSHSQVSINFDKGDVHVRAASGQGVAPQGLGGLPNLPPRRRVPSAKVETEKISLEL